MHIILEAHLYKLAPCDAHNSNIAGDSICIKMFAVHTALHQSLNLNSLSKYAAFTLKSQRPINFGFSLDKKQNIIEHIALINNNLIGIEPA